MRKCNLTILAAAAALTLTLCTEPMSVAAAGQYRSEMTNEWIDSSIQKQRPIAAIVDNEKKALPHYGMSNADVVYEITNSLQNDGVTRFMVLVKDWGNIKQLGSIRSARPTHFLLSPEWNAVVCHDGGPFYINDYLKRPYIYNFSGTFSRVKNGKPREFTEYILAGDLKKNFSSKKYSTQYDKNYPGKHFQFATDEAPTVLASGSVSAARVTLPYKKNKPYLTYNADTGLYNYFEYGKAHVDPGNNNAQLSFKNVIIQNTTYSQLDKNGYLIFNCIDTGRTGYYLTGGKAIPITWNKKSDTDITRFYDAGGKEIKLNTGKTYIAIVPDDLWSGLKIQ